MYGVMQPPKLVEDNQAVRAHSWEDDKTAWYCFQKSDGLDKKSEPQKMAMLMCQAQQHVLLLLILKEKENLLKKHRMHSTNFSCPRKT